MARSYDLWIDGRSSKTGGSIDRHSPAHGGLLARFAEGTKDDVDRAIAAARRSFEGREWQDAPGSKKAGVLNAWADLIAANLEKLAVMEAEESGKPIRFARGEIAWAVDMTRYAGGLAWQLTGNAFTNLGDSALGLVTREPRGVVGMIVPWNFPLITLMQKLPFALAVGCSTVIKPSELTSSTALEVAAMATDAGMPAGVINIVTGYGETVGEALSTHAGLDMISFTGSTRVGEQIGRNQGSRIGRVALELGGKGANIVFADADIDAALDGVLFGMVLNQGEECCAGSRLIIDRSIAEGFTQKLAERARRVRVGMPLDEDSDISALVSERQLNSVLRHIAIGKDEGCRLVTGGARLMDVGRNKGFFVAPTIFAEVNPDATIFREEIFGPILTVTAFGSEEEAIDLANDTHYGLANGFWTKDVDKVHRVSRRLRSGTVYVNTYLETSVQLPFGGYKKSGVGRELGLEGLLEFTETKSTFIKLGGRQPSLPHTIA
jgi:betaine-aldehyde dehydrogenase